MKAWYSQPTCKNCSYGSIHNTVAQSYLLLISPFLQTNITSQMWPTGGKGVAIRLRYQFAVSALWESYWYEDIISQIGTQSSAMRQKVYNYRHCRSVKCIISRLSRRGNCLTMKATHAELWSLPTIQWQKTTYGLVDMLLSLTRWPWKVVSM